MQTYCKFCFCPSNVSHNLGWKTRWEEKCLHNVTRIPLTMSGANTDDYPYCQGFIMCIVAVGPRIKNWKLFSFKVNKTSPIPLSNPTFESVHFEGFFFAHIYLFQLKLKLMFKTRSFVQAKIRILISLYGTGEC